MWCEMEDWVEKDLGSYLFASSVMLALFGVVLLFWFVLGLISWAWSLFGVVGLLGVFFIPAQKISVSAVRRAVKVERYGFFRGMSFLVKFSDIEGLSVGELKGVLGGHSLYYLNLRLKSGSVVPIYVGFFQHFFDRVKVEKKLNRLEILIFQN